MDRAEKSIDSKFRFVLLAAARAEQIMHGARPRVDLKCATLARIAMTELEDNLLVWDYGPAPVPEPIEELGEGESAASGEDGGGGAVDGVN